MSSISEDEDEENSSVEKSDSDTEDNDDNDDDDELQNPNHQHRHNSVSDSSSGDEDDDEEDDRDDRRHSSHKKQNQKNVNKKKKKKCNDDDDDDSSSDDDEFMNNHNNTRGKNSNPKKTQRWNSKHNNENKTNGRKSKHRNDNRSQSRQMNDHRHHHVDVIDDEKFNGAGACSNREYKAMRKLRKQQQQRGGHQTVTNDTLLLSNEQFKQLKKLNKKNKKAKGGAPSSQFSFLNAKRKGNLMDTSSYENDKVHEFHGHTRSIKTFASMNGYLYSAGHDATVIQWDPYSGRLRGKCSQMHKSVIQDMTTFPKYNMLVTASHDMSVGFLRVRHDEDDGASDHRKTGQWLHHMHGGVTMELDMGALHLEKRFELLGRQKVHSSWVTCIAADTDHDIAYSGSFDSTVRRWDLHQHGYCGVTNNSYSNGDSNMDNNDIRVGYQVSAMCYNRTHSSLIVAGFKGDVDLYDTRTLVFGDRSGSSTLNAPSETRKGHSGSINYVTNRKYHEFWTCGHDSNIMGWDIRMMKPFCCLQGHTKGVNYLAVSQRNSNIVYSASPDRTIRVWNVQNQSCESVIAMNLEVDCITVVADDRTDPWLMKQQLHQMTRHKRSLLTDIEIVTQD